MFDCSARQHIPRFGGDSLAEAVLIAQIGDRWVASSQGVVLTLQHRLPEVIARAVAAARQIAERGVAVEVIVENRASRYTVWNSVVDGFVGGAGQSSGSSAPG